MSQPSAPQLHGVIPPLVTPFDADGAVHRQALEKLVEFQLGAGVHALFIGGSTGEVALLDSAQRQTALEVVIGATAGSVPVVAGAVDTGTRRVIEQARQAEKLGADAVVTTAPFYIRPHDSEIIEHFRQLNAAIDLPVVAYDIPSAVGTRLSPTVIAELAHAGLACAVKDSSGDLAAFRDILRHTEGLRFDVLTGSELFADAAVALGADGIVPGLGNVDPHGYVRLYDAARAGNTAGASTEQRRLHRLFDIISVADTGRIGFTAGALGGFKAALATRGVIPRADTATPLLPLNEAEIASIATILAETGLGQVTST
ncbi:4-hydroxy-tetrahydrodipicolinate synthase [Tamaricihabitans halophyticus]|uniref:4-hydroxy-tetrahydrodipicolinate synthase n=1 Tax=Tamaricihabitans halophyticus TaxID=1262583 RepID=A0A4R2QCN3_9PSEU|nr:dihydrodipicolinate synthase family protein [Tamaricihabitans halophyticus]TCP46802.1 4-hydroxy-tetrahydrodipicolinate synthase [Tamaricihabitans halophyticus]